jgi:hypothetical protein
MPSSPPSHNHSANPMATLPDNFTQISAAKTAAMLTNVESTIEDMKKFRDGILPERCAILKKEIHNNKRSANLLLLTAHVSLRDKIVYEQQKRAVTRQNGILVEIESQTAKWTTLLEKAREQKKQLKRLQRVQQEYAITSQFPDCDEEYTLGLEKRMTIAMDRCLRAQRTYGELVQEVKTDTDRLTDEDSEWHQKQDELDEKAKERAREAARKRKEAKTKDRCWGPSKSKKDVKKCKGQNQDSKAKTKKQRRR